MSSDRIAAGTPSFEGHRDCGAHGEQQERKNEIGHRPSVPRGVVQRRVDSRPVAGRADEDHAGNGGAPEHVE